MQTTPRERLERRSLKNGTRKDQQCTIILAGRNKQLFIIVTPILAYLLKDVHDDVRAIHQSVVCALHDLDSTPTGAHVLLHPSYGVLRDAFVFVPIPHAHLVRVSRVRKAPRSLVVVQNLQEIRVRAFRRLRVRGCNECIAQRNLIRLCWLFRAREEATTRKRRGRWRWYDSIRTRSRSERY